MKTVAVIALALLALQAGKSHQKNTNIGFHDLHRPRLCRVAGDTCTRAGRTRFYAR